MGSITVPLDVGIVVAVIAALGGIALELVRRYRGRHQQSADAVPGLVQLVAALTGRANDAEARADKSDDARDRMRAERDAAFVARDVAESKNRLLRGHMVVLEQHILDRKEPPPPARPEGVLDV